LRCSIRFGSFNFYAEEWRVYDEDHILFIHLFQHSGGLNEYLRKIQLPEQF